MKPAAEQTARLAAELRNAEDMNRDILASLRTLVERFKSKTSPVLEQSATPPLVSPPSKVRLPSATPAPAPIAANDGLSTSEQKVLDALASLEAVGVETPSKMQLAAFAGYSNPKSGGFAAPAGGSGAKGHDGIERGQSLYNSFWARRC